MWMQSFSDKLRQLAQGIWDIPGTGTIRSIRCSAVPKVHTVTYYRICVNYFLQKEDPNRTILLFSDKRIHFPWDVSTPTSDISTSNILFNPVIYTQGAILITMYIKKLLLWHPHKTSGIHVTTHQHPTTINYQPAQIERIRIISLCVLGYFQSNVRLTTSRKYCQWPPHLETRWIRMLPIPVYSCPMASQMAPHCIQPGFIWIFHKIWGPTTLSAPEGGTQNTSRGISRLGSFFVEWVPTGNTRY